MYRNLLAKGWDPASSPSPPAHVRLIPHLRAVQEAARSIVDGAGAGMLDNLGLAHQPWLARLRVTLGLAALLHDLGKANSYFQGMVRRKADFPSIRQPIRHELLTALLLLRNSGGLADWLRQQFVDAGEQTHADDLANVVLAATAGHHGKLDADWNKAFPGDARGGGTTSIDLYLGHENLKVVFGDLSPLTDEHWSLLRTRDPAGSHPSRSYLDFRKRSCAWQDRVAAEPEWWRFAAAVKALTVAADVAGSALLPEGISPGKWVGHALARRPSPEDLRGVVEERLAGRAARPFQRAIEDSSSRVTLVEAGCGTGKTVAAYAWASRQLAGRKLFFCYPTMGTATEGFLDYVASSRLEARLMHSRAGVDLERVAMSREESGTAEQEDEQLRLASLRLWQPQVVICTVDTVLALMRNNRRGLYAAPALLSGGFVFDEVHAYDDQMLGAMVGLIRALPGAPFLLMSASLPAARKAVLQRELGDIASIAPPIELESIPRYVFHRPADLSEALGEAATLVCRGARVLWVCNVVSRAQRVHDLARAAGIPVVAYHSRFKYEHRQLRHREVVEAFAGTDGQGLLAVTTQVAEMSLDLDADLLVTEVAPVPSLTQRLGRLNRRVTEDDPGRPRPAWILAADGAAPYKERELNTASVWLDRLIGLGRPASQRDLAEQSAMLADAAPVQLDLRMEWLDSGYCAEPGAVREPGFTVPVILAEDAAACRASAKAFVCCSLPMPYRQRMTGWPTLRGGLVAPEGSIQYDEFRGAKWAD